MTSTRMLCAIALAGLGACANTATVALRPGPATVTADEFPGAARLLEGFSPLVYGDEWSAGDAVLYGLRLRRGAELQHWLLHLRLDEPLLPTQPLVWNLQVNGEAQQFESRLAQVTATVADKDGHVLGTTTPSMPRDFLAQGIWEACARIPRDSGALTSTDGAQVAGAAAAGAEARRLAEAVVCAMALLDTVRGDPLLSPILWSVVEKPSIWSVISNLGVAVVVQPRFRQAREVAPPLSKMPHVKAWRVPIDLFVNEVPALVAELVVGASLPPFGVGGGILGAVARHPSDPEVEFEILLLAARRGAPPVAEVPIVGN